MLKRIILLLFVMPSSLFSIAQIDRHVWPSTAIYPYLLQGSVKSWQMTMGDQQHRKITFDSNGLTLSDTHVPDDYEWDPHPVSEKHELEFRYVDQKAYEAINGETEWNEFSQIIKTTVDELLIENEFDDTGNVLSSKTIKINKHVYSHDSRGPIIPPITYFDTTYTLTLFRYNEKGSLVEFVYLNSDIFKNLGYKFLRDSNDVLIRRLKYDSHDILKVRFEEVDTYDDDYLNQIITIINKKKMTHEEIWGHQLIYNYARPWKQVFTNDSLGNCIESKEFAYRPMMGAAQVTTRAVYEYQNGKLHKETQYDGREQVRNILLYDQYGNVIHETTFYGGKTSIYEYKIEYYE